MEDGDDTYDYSPVLPTISFWANYSCLKGHISSLKRKRTPLEYYDPCQLCMDVEERILKFEEEPNLSPLQNKVRKLDRGTELCREICLLQRHFSNLEINKAVSKILEIDRYNIIAKRINKWENMKLQRERFFYQKALKSIKESLGNENEEDELKQQKEKATASEAAVAGDPTPQEVEAPTEVARNISEQSLQASDYISENLTSNPKDASYQETGRNFPAESVFVHDENVRISNGDLDETRVPDISAPNGDVTLPEIRKGHIDRSSYFNDLSQIQHILENNISGQPPDIEPGPLPQVLGEPELPKLLNNITQENDLESLPPATVTPTRRRRLRPIFDRFITIPNYTERARRLNQSVILQRVQVYEGPPSLLQSFTLNHMLTTPAVNNGLLRTVRSTVLENLYRRHQQTQQVAYEALERDITERGAVVQEQQMQVEIQEAAGSRRTQPLEQNYQFMDISVIQPITSEMRESAINQNNSVEAQLERLHGTPVSRILQREVVPPKIGAANPWLSPRSPRIQNLQGTRIEEPIAEPWFSAVEQPAPDEKWREFDYVRKCLVDIWTEKEKNGMEKSATLREVLETKQNWNKENMLTLLRIVDKMSLRREVVLRGCGENVIIQPFEMPFVGEKQYDLRNECPTF